MSVPAGGQEPNAQGQEPNATTLPPTTGQPVPTPAAQRQEGQEPPERYDADYVKDLRRSEAASRKKSADLEARIKAQEDEKLGETEKLAKRLAEAEQRAQEAQDRLVTQTLRLEVERQARKLNIVDEEAAFVLLDKDGLAESDDLAKSVEQRLKKLVESKPWLVAQPQAVTRAVPGTPTAGAPVTKEQRVNDLYERMRQGPVPRL